MSSLALNEVQRALYAALQADAILDGMVSGVHDNVPQSAPLPYVVIGDGTQRQIAAEGLDGAELTLDLEVWAESGGRKTVLLILNRLWAILHLATLNVTGFETLSVRGEQAETSVSEEGTRIRGRLVIQATVVEA